MKPEFEKLGLVNNTVENRFELPMQEGTAFIEYKRSGDRLFLIHTEVPESLEGKGVAGAIAEKTFRYLEENKLGLIPYCPFILTYLKRHPEWSRILAPDTSAP